MDYCQLVSGRNFTLTSPVNCLCVKAQYENRSETRQEQYTSPPPSHNSSARLIEMTGINFQHNMSPSMCSREDQVPSLSSTRANGHETMSHINDLYPELLANIFSHLDLGDKGRVAQVCKFWQQVAYIKSIWKGVEAKLHLTACSRRAVNCTCSVDNSSRSTRQHALSSVSCRTKSSQLYSSLVSRGIKRIQILSTSESLHTLTKSIDNLESLVLGGCFSLRDDLFQLAPNLSNLKVLDLSMCKRITDVSIFRVCHSAPYLKSLNLSGCSALSNDSLAVIESHLKHLRSLSLSNCPGLKDSGIAIICGQYFGYLHSSSLSAIAVQSSSRARKNSSHRSCLSSKGSKLHHDKHRSRGLRRLENLTLSACHKLTDDSLKYISVGLKSLKTLDISCCSSFTDYGFKHLASSTVGSNLRDINLRQCDNITDLTLKHLSQANNVMKSLDVSFCDSITDEACNYISQGLNTLQKLSMNSCDITDVGLTRLSTSLHDLQVLNIAQCSAVSDVGMLKVINNCPTLKSADIYGCAKISSSTIDKLVNAQITLSCRLWPNQVTTINKQGELVDTINSPSTTTLPTSANEASSGTKRTSDDRVKSASVAKSSSIVYNSLASLYDVQHLTSNQHSQMFHSHSFNEHSVHLNSANYCNGLPDHQQSVDVAVDHLKSSLHCGHSGINNHLACKRGKYDHHHNNCLHNHNHHQQQQVNTHQGVYHIQSFYPYTCPMFHLACSSFISTSPHPHHHHHHHN